jgi:extradiol dioxygenase family protein
MHSAGVKSTGAGARFVGCMRHQKANAASIRQFYGHHVSTHNKHKFNGIAVE